MPANIPEPVAKVTHGAPAPVKLLSALLCAFGALAFAGSTVLWGQGLIWRPPAGVNVALPVADMLVNAPASMMAGVGLWRQRRYGYVAGYFVAGLYLYASLFIIVEAAVTRPPAFWLIVLPQLLAVLAAVALLVLLPRHRTRFN